MTMYSFPFPVRAEYPSANPQFNGAKLTAERVFLVHCGYAEQLALRMMGKYYIVSDEETYTTPVLPAPWPKWENEIDQLLPNLPYSSNCIVSARLNMVARSFSIEPVSGCCFNAYSVDRTEDLQDTIANPTTVSQLERNFPVTAGETSADPYTVSTNADDDCICRVRIQYEERPWDCAWPEVNILQNTAIAVERNASYEMYTLPNRNLEWKNLQAPDRFLKGDSYAVQIVPKCDITVYWFNVPVAKMCEIESHLATFRGKVNEHNFEMLAECICESEDGENCNSAAESGNQWNSCVFEPETLLFVDWSEDLNARTRGFHKMNTTTLKLHFKQKRVARDSVAEPIAGWNHLFIDRDGANDFISGWQRVIKKVGGIEQDLFMKTDFDLIMNP